MFAPATREKTKLKMCLAGPAGSGKSYTALRLAHAMKRAGLGTKIAVGESEGGKIKKYVGYVVDGDRWQFDLRVLDNFSPNDYVSVIEAAVRAGYDIIILDSISHEWQGKGGALELVDKVDGKNKFTSGWKTVTPMHNTFIDTVLRAPIHVIATCRSKMGHVLEDVQKDGRTIQVPRRVGMEPVQRNGIEYEFEIFCELDTSHILRVVKTICPLIDGKTVVEPGPDFFAPIFSWLGEGVEITASGFRSALVPAAAIEKLLTSMHDVGVDMTREGEWILAKFGATEWAHLTPEQFEKYSARADALIANARQATARLEAAAQPASQSDSEKVDFPPTEESQVRKDAPHDGQGHEAPSSSPASSPVAAPAAAAPINGHAAPVPANGEYVRPKSLPQDPAAAAQTLFEELAHLSGWSHEQKEGVWKITLAKFDGATQAKELKREHADQLERILYVKVREIYEKRGMTAAMPT